MEWIDGVERRKFAREQSRLRKEYLAAGMTEEQIAELRAFDEDWYNSRRREAVHTQALDIYTSEDEERKDNPLIEKFPDRLTVTDKHWQGRYAWIEQIADESLYRAVDALSKEDKELLTLLCNVVCVACNISYRQTARYNHGECGDKFVTSL